jgi:hypothetical protein
VSLRIDVFLHLPDGAHDHRIDDILAIVKRIVTKQELTMALLDDIVTKVTALTAVDDSVVALLTELKAKLDAAIASNDPVKLQAISDALGVQTQRLADAVTANTPTP